MGSCGSGKKRGVKLKEKVAGAGVAANVFWRKKGCVDWWRSLGEDTRRKVLTAVLGKSMRYLICKILREYDSGDASEDWLLPFSRELERPAYIKGESLQRNIAGLATNAARLSLLEIVVTAMSSGWHCEYHISNVFFSTLDSVGGVTDCVLRKLRGLFMVISLDCTKLELLGDGNAQESPKIPHGKLVPSSSKKKGKTQSIKKLNSATKTSTDATSFDRPSQGCCYKTIPMDSFGEPGVHNKHESARELSTSIMEMEHSQGSDLVKGQAVARKTRKRKGKKSKCKISVELVASGLVIAEAHHLPPTSSDVDAAMCLGSGSSTMQNSSNKNSVVSDVQASEKCLSDSTNESTRLHFDDIGINDHIIDHNGGVYHTSTRNDCDVIPQCHSSDSLVDDKFLALSVESLTAKLECDVPSDVPALGFGKIPSNSCTNLDVENIKEKSNESEGSVKAIDVKGKTTLMQGQVNRNFYDTRFTSHVPYLSYEWPNSTPVYFQSVNSHIPPATDRLHLDVGTNWHTHIRQPYVPTVRQVRNSSIESSHSCMLSRPLPMSLDWPPMVRSASGLAPSLTCNYGSEFISRRQTAFTQSYASPCAQKVEFSAKTIDDEQKYSRDSVDLPEAIHGQELMDECDDHWMPEDELEVHAVSEVDYNQYFGGGVMYWNPSDHPFSRPPSLSSDDSLWAWHEADMSTAVDDMVAFSSSYSTNGLASPPATSFCSPFDALGSGHQALGYVVSGNEVSGKVLHASTDAAKEEEEVSGSLTTLSGDIEGKVADSFSYPILRPIIIPSMSRERPKRSHDKSPCIPTNRQEQPRIKRPPSPVVLCVPRAPRPPPPSPVSDSRKHRAFPIVRSGSSSPRHWGMRGWYQDGINLEEACVRMDGPEVVWPSWMKKNPSQAHARIQPLPGTLLQDRLIALSQLALDQEHTDVSFPLQPPELENSPTRKASLSLIHSLLHDEIDFFHKQVTAANIARRPFINWAVKRVARSLQVLWPRSRTNIFGSNATGLSLPTSDVDLVVCLPPVRNLEPIKEAGILEGRNGIKETCLQHAARYLANQEWVKNDSLRTVENTAIPIIMLVVEVPDDLITSASNVQSPEDTSSVTIELDDSVQSDVAGSDDSMSPKVSHVNHDDMHEVKSIRLDISFKSPSHTGLQTTELVKALTEQFPAAAPLALVLKQFLADRSLDQSYSGGLSSYCLVLFVIRFLQHEHHLGRPINQNFGSLLMDFLYFFGNVFDPRQMRISVQGSGVYINRERGCSIDPLNVDDPLFPTNNVGRNCFRIHQCIKAFAEAYSILETAHIETQDEGDLCTRPTYRLLSKIIPSINLVKGN